MEKAQILVKIEEIVVSEGFLLIDVVIRGDNKLRIIEIFVDSEEAVTAEMCSALSRQINDVISENNLIESSYRLDVSSPGVERPLKFLLQFKKHINRKFEVSYTEDTATKKIVGKLTGIENDVLLFVEKNNEHPINFSNILKAKVLISF